MFGKLFKSAPVKTTKSDNFMQNISAMKKEVQPVKRHHEESNDAISEEIKEQILEKSKTLNIKTFASEGFLNMINEAKSEIEIVPKETEKTKDEKFDEAFNSGIYFIHKFAKNSENTDDLKQALNLFVEATAIKKSRAEPYYFLAYICYLVNDIPLAEKYFKISSYLKPEQKYLMALGRKISNLKMSKVGGKR